MLDRAGMIADLTAMIRRARLNSMWTPMRPTRTDLDRLAFAVQCEEFRHVLRVHEFLRIYGRPVTGNDDIIYVYRRTDVKP